jgi:DDE family transposase
LEHDTAGDPITGLRWTHKTTEKIAQQLQLAGIQVGCSTVARLLYQLGYSLRINQKRLAATCSPDRDQQFLWIQDMRHRFQRRGQPIISVDTKKQEQIGNFKNPGAKWDSSAEAVNDHDFPSLGLGKGIPYGIYDPQANRGSVFVGISHDTPHFAVTSICSWWCWEGRHRYPDAKRLLILADAGGSNSPSNGLWKVQLQAQLCDRFGLSITVCHYPTGASKWNPIEHRLFSEITKNWAGEPLRSYETMLNFIRTTKTESGLRVKAYLDRRTYPIGLKVSPEHLSQLRITYHDPLPRWNYTLKAM